MENFSVTNKGVKLIIESNNFYKFFKNEFNEK